MRTHMLACDKPCSADTSQVNRTRKNRAHRSVQGLWVGFVPQGIVWKVGRGRWGRGRLRTYLLQLSPPFFLLLASSDAPSR